MKVIKPGSLPQKKVYRAICPNCGCIFEFTKEEAKLRPDQRDGDSLVINCPTTGCNKETWVAV